MGLSLEFDAGDALAIGEDFSAIEFDGLRDGTRAGPYADFSLHLSSADLDTLSAAIAESIGVSPVLLGDSLVRTDRGFEGEGGAEVVDPAWVRMVASADEGTAPKLAAEWMRRVGADYGRLWIVTPEAERRYASRSDCAGSPSGRVWKSSTPGISEGLTKHSSGPAAGAAEFGRWAATLPPAGHTLVSPNKSQTAAPGPVQAAVPRTGLSQGECHDWKANPRQETGARLPTSIEGLRPVCRNQEGLDEARAAVAA
jgi:hypothetical protein